MNDNIEDILKQTRLTVERGEVESIVKNTLAVEGGTGSSPLRSVCSDKVVSIVDEKINTHYRLMNLETEKLILEMRGEIKKDVHQAIKEAVNQSKERNNWAMEVLRLAITIATAIGAVKMIAM